MDGWMQKVASKEYIANFFVPLTYLPSQACSTSASSVFPASSLHAPFSAHIAMHTVYIIASYIYYIVWVSTGHQRV